MKSIKIPEDYLKPLERQRLYFSGEKVDRLPCVASMLEEVAKLIGYSFLGLIN